MCLLADLDTTGMSSVRPSLLLVPRVGELEAERTVEVVPTRDRSPSPFPSRDNENNLARDIFIEFSLLLRITQYRSAPATAGKVSPGRVDSRGKI